MGNLNYFQKVIIKQNLPLSTKNDFLFTWKTICDILLCGKKRQYK